MYLWHLSNPDLTQAVILGRSAQAEAIRGAAYTALRGGEIAATGLFGGVAALFGQAFARYRRWRTVKATIDELRSLDDRLLADIGLHRGEIRSLVAEVYRDQDGPAAERLRAAGPRRAAAGHRPERADDRTLPLAA